jgi:hypothetical protein
MSDKMKLQRRAILVAWRQLTIAAANANDDDQRIFQESADLLVEAFPDFTGGKP